MEDLPDSKVDEHPLERPSPFTVSTEDVPAPVGRSRVPWLTNGNEVLRLLIPSVVVTVPPFPYARDVLASRVCTTVSLDSSPGRPVVTERGRHGTKRSTFHHAGSVGGRLSTSGTKDSRRVVWLSITWKDHISSLVPTCDSPVVVVEPVTDYDLYFVFLRTMDFYFRYQVVHMGVGRLS